MVNYEAFANEGFNANAVVYSAIMYKVRSITIAPLRAYTGSPEEPELLPPDHPLQKLCLRPNRFQSWSEFQALATVYFNLSGNCYIVLDRDGDQVSAMYLLRPDRVYIVPNRKKDMVGFWYVPEGRAWVDGVPYLPQDTIHIKLPNPVDPLDGLGYGLSPLSPAARSADVDNDLTKFLRLFFKSGAMPPGLLSFDVPMEDDDVSRARERWMEIYGSYENWTDVAVLDQGGKYQRIGYNFQEMDVSALDARNESRIVAPFGVPLNLIESRPELVQSTYSNKQEDRVMFWQDTMVPELLWFETDYRYYLQGDGGEFVMFDLSQVPALSMTQVERVKMLQRAYETGAVDADELRAALDLDPLPERQERPTG
jgi:HK97 family phage portal protein